MKIKITEKQLRNLVVSCLKETNQYDEFGFYNEPDDEEDKEASIDDLQQLEYLLGVVEKLHLIDSDVYAQELSTNLREQIKNNEISADLLNKFKTRINNKISNMLNSLNMLGQELDRIYEEYKPEEKEDISF